MKKSIIKEVLNERRGQADLMKMTEEEGRLNGIVSDAYHKLIEQLSQQQLELYRIYESAKDNQLIEELDNYYVAGFKLGLLIGIECMDE